MNTTKIKSVLKSVLKNVCAGIIFLSVIQASANGGQMINEIIRAHQSQQVISMMQPQYVLTDFIKGA